MMSFFLSHDGQRSQAVTRLALDRASSDTFYSSFIYREFIDEMNANIKKGGAL